MWFLWQNLSLSSAKSQRKTVKKSYRHIRLFESPLEFTGRLGGAQGALTSAIYLYCVWFVFCNRHFEFLIPALGKLRGFGTEITEIARNRLPVPKVDDLLLQKESYFMFSHNGTLKKAQKLGRFNLGALSKDSWKRLLG